MDLGSTLHEVAEAEEIRIKRTGATLQLSPLLHSTWLQRAINAHSPIMRRLMEPQRTENELVGNVCSPKLTIRRNEKSFTSCLVLLTIYYL
jgi:hypothetical protein